MFQLFSLIPKSKGGSGEGFDVSKPFMNSDQRLSYLHLMNKAAESEDRQSYFYYLKLAEETLQRQDPEVLWKPAG